MLLNEFTDKLLASAKAEGIDTAEVYSVKRENTEIIARGDSKDFKSNLSISVRFRAIINGKMGYAYTEAIDEEAVEQLIKGVKDATSLIEDEDEQFMFEGAEEYPTIEYSKRDENTPSAKQMISALDGLEAYAKAKDSKVAGMDQAVLQRKNSKINIVNTKGMNLEFSDSVYISYVSILAKDGDDVSTQYESHISRNFEDINFKNLADKAIEKAIEALHAKPISSGLYNIVINNEAMGELLDTYSPIFSAENAQKGLSLMAGKEGSLVANQAVKLVDNPLLKDGWSSCPFDDEGVPSKNKNIIENGKLITLLHNLKTANKAGLESTGNASSSNVSPTNMYFENGDISFDDMLNNIGEGIVITELSAMHSGANAISGDFSLPAKGYTFKNGKKDKMLNQITVSSNFYTLLKQMECFANDLAFKRPIASPSVYVGKLSVAGK
ncbi:MAG: TldD/PmbA family protein [Christensenellaceae bacterium]|nr:TldD/PmbA family protein [Christensenellaceae bacterium]